jgi:hypothetical protein
MPADPAGVFLSQISAERTKSDPFLYFDYRTRQILTELGVLLKDEVGKPFSRFSANAGQPRKLTYESGYNALLFQ